jgi:hypothetical protein
MKKALWFSGEEPTAAELEDIKQLGSELANMKQGVYIGGVLLRDENSVVYALKDIQRMAVFHGATACFGVFAVPLRRAMFEFVDAGGKEGIMCFEAWYTPPRGHRLPKEFRHWCPVGVLPKGEML